MVLHMAYIYPMEWTVEFLDDRVEAEFAALPIDFQASIMRVADLIRKYGLENVGMPYVRHIQGKIWEMRGRGHGAARSLYVTAKERRVIILRSFVKKTPRTPGGEVNIAQERAKEAR